MEPVPRPHIDLLAIGEVVVDLIATDPGTGLAGATHYERVTGGSVANVAATYAWLGGRAALVAAVGDGPLADAAEADLRASGVECLLRRVPRRGPTLAFVTRGETTPDFWLRRDADPHLSAADVSPGLVERATVVHTSAFALSREPSRSAIHAVVQRARAAGVTTSIDLNFHETLADAPGGRGELRQAIERSDLVKASRDDLERLFNGPIGPEDGARRIRGLGPSTVVVTLGADGAWFDSPEGCGHRPARPVATVVDTTGAGDAFWAGLLLARRPGVPLAEAVEAGLDVAARKLEVAGPLRDADIPGRRR